MTRFVQDALDIMSLALGRRNTNDPDSNTVKLLQYFNDFVTLEMPNDTKLFESFGTLTFNIDQTVTDGVYSFKDVSNDLFINVVEQGFVSLTSQPTDSASWNEISLYQNPLQFYEKWGVNNEDVLIPGYPTDMLFYGDQFVFRTIPDVSYTITLYGYTKLADFTTVSEELPFDWWLRYVAYGAARQYAVDFRLSPQTLQNIEREFNKQKKLMLTRTHNQIKKGRAAPHF